MPLKKLNVLFENKTPVGTLVLDGSDAPFFQYATEWLEGGFELSPRWWPRRAELYPPNTEPE
ncbi:MAG: hypothetical protein LBR07_02540, partial [Puniceicoccales bacterium]|nr:hypothetical protein [Puniceicoccales bacterium]